MDYTDKLYKYCEQKRKEAEKILFKNSANDYVLSDRNDNCIFVEFDPCRRINYLYVEKSKYPNADNILSKKYIAKKMTFGKCTKIKRVPIIISEITDEGNTYKVYFDHTRIFDVDDLNCTKYISGNYKYGDRIVFRKGRKNIFRTVVENITITSEIFKRTHHDNINLDEFIKFTGSNKVWKLNRI